MNNFENNVINVFNEAANNIKSFRELETGAYEIVRLFIKKTSCGPTVILIIKYQDENVSVYLQKRISDNLSEYVEKNPTVHPNKVIYNGMKGKAFDIGFSNH